MNFSAVILAGGQSRRMGRDKARLPCGGETLLARQIGVARELGPREIFISGRADADYGGFGCKVIIDKVPDAGPLAGVARALEESAASLLLVLAVDMPRMEASFLRRLWAICAPDSGAIPRVGGRIEPLAAFYPKSTQAAAETMLQVGRRAMTDFAAGCAQSSLAVMLDVAREDEFYFENWNTPEEVRP